MRPLHVVWLVLALLAVGLRHFADRAAYVDSYGVLHDSILMPVGIIFLLVAFMLALADRYTFSKS